MGDIARLDGADSPYLTSEEAAVHCRYRTVDAFRTWARRRGIVPCRDGRRLLWLKVDLDNRLQSNRRAVLRSRALRSA